MAYPNKDNASVYIRANVRAYRVVHDLYALFFCPIQSAVAGGSDVAGGPSAGRDRLGKGSRIRLQGEFLNGYLRRPSLKVILFMGYSDIKGPFKRGGSEPPFSMPYFPCRVPRTSFLCRVFRTAFSVPRRS